MSIFSNHVAMLLFYLLWCRSILLYRIPESDHCARAAREISRLILWKKPWAGPGSYRQTFPKCKGGRDGLLAGIWCKMKHSQFIPNSVIIKREVLPLTPESDRLNYFDVVLTAGGKLQMQCGNSLGWRQTGHISHLVCPKMDLRSKVIHLPF